jgi:hypothetical protein
MLRANKYISFSSLDPRSDMAEDQPTLAVARILRAPKLRLAGKSIRVRDPWNSEWLEVFDLADRETDLHEKRENNSARGPALTCEERTIVQSFLQVNQKTFYPTNPTTPIKCRGIEPSATFG